jgi:hypothetical protein
VDLPRTLDHRYGEFPVYVDLPRTLDHRYGEFPVYDAIGWLG